MAVPTLEDQKQIDNKLKWQDFHEAPRDKIKILCLSIWYPLSMSRYFERAMRRNSLIDLKTVGPYTGSWIPWLGGMELPAKYAVPPDLPLPFPTTINEVNYEFVKAHLKNWVPDIVMNVDAGIHWKYKPSDGMVVHVATDPHVLNYDYQHTISDKFFNMQKVYSQPKDIWLPYAYDPTVFYPDDTVSKDTDAVLIGMPYAQRQEWVTSLRNRGVSVIFENGPVFDEARQLYARGRIGLNWSSMQDLNARAFELAAMKLCPVSNFVPDMQEFEVFSRFLTFNSLDEAIKQVVWAKEHPEESKDVAERVYEEVKPHTYDTRIVQILKECGF